MSQVVAIVEDDPEIRSLLTELLRREGFEVEPCGDVPQFDRLREVRRIDLVILDVMLPGEDGLSLCRRLRATGETAVLMVTAKGDDIDRIIGLEIGADDYLAKPFNPRELIARARAILRRTQHSAPSESRDAHEREVFGFGGWRLDAASRELTSPSGVPVELTGGEFDLLISLVRRPQRVLNRDQLLDWTRGRSASPFDRTIDVQLSRLRKKLNAHDENATLIRTVRGGGYMLSSPVLRE
jgi:two-component system OmpR family response regulator